MSTVMESFSMTAHQVLQIAEEIDAVMPIGKGGNPEGVEIELQSDWPQTLCVKELCYDVHVKGGINMMKKVRKGIVLLSGHAVGKKPDVGEYEREGNRLRLLNKVNAIFPRGRLCALMGTSGAGKTTFMDVIAGYKTDSSIVGDILIDGLKKNDAIWRKISGYAEQNDILNPYLTVLETVRFTTECRLPKTKDRQEIIDRIPSLLDLNQWGNVVIGREVDGEGLPKHARKRLTIAIQLVVEPKILFLDEPTTGLDQIAARLIDSVSKATRTMSLITVATIHQPSKHIWSSFDDILLLFKGGRVAYMGEAGNDSSTILPYFQSLTNDIAAPSNCNPADYCLGILNEMEPKNAETSFLHSKINECLTKGIEEAVASTKDAPLMDLKRVNNVLRSAF